MRFIIIRNVNLVDVVRISYEVNPKCFIGNLLPEAQTDYPIHFRPGIHLSVRQRIRFVRMITPRRSAVCFAAWHALFRLRAATEAAEEQEADEVDCILAWKEGGRGSAKHCAGPELSRVVFESVR